MTTVQLQAPEIHCGHCKMSIEQAVSSLDGVAGVEVTIADAMVSVQYDEDAIDLVEIKKAIEEQGYAVFG